MMTGANALGFDRVSQSWVADAAGRSVGQVPPLDGALLVDEAALSDGGEDFGHIQCRRPLAVLEPGSSEDVVRMVNFAREQGIRIGARGRGSSVFGQSLVEGGILIKMQAFNPAPVFGADRVQVSAGRSWTEVLALTLPRGLRPPVLTHNTELSVGGTLSVGGMDGGSYRHGGQVDNVLELEVVTGEGSLETCSATRLPELFNAVLAGLGQCAIILRATLRLVPAGSHVRIFELLYPDLNTMLDDERLMVADGRVDRISGYLFPSVGGKWRYYIQADHNFAPPDEPGKELLPPGMKYMRGFERVYSMPYFDFVTHNPRQTDLGQTGRIKLPHPWLDVFVPASEADQYLADTMGKLTPADIGVDFPISFFFVNTAACTRPLLRLPDEPLACLWNLMTTMPDREAADRIVDLNRQFFDRARAVGGKHLPVSAMPLSRQDWQEHFDPYWEQFVRAKHRFDPDNILSPGPGIF
jgi:cytokinin dehydrogenase